MELFRLQGLTDAVDSLLLGLVQLDGVMCLYGDCGKRVPQPFDLFNHEDPELHQPLQCCMRRGEFVAQLAQAGGLFCLNEFEDFALPRTFW